MNDSTNNILITGAAGYLGNLVFQALAQKAGEAGSIGHITGMDIRQPEELPSHSVRFVEMDVRATELSRFIEEQQINTVIHLASIVTPGKGQDRAFQYSVDVEGTANLLKACVANHVEKIIVTSSGAAYGYHADNPAWLTEECAIRGNEEFAYAYHKRLVEEMMAQYRKDYPWLKQVIFRVGTILGRSVRNQITALFDKSRLIAVKGANSPFVFIWDEDVVRCIEMAATTDKTGIYNLAGDGALTIQELASILGKSTITLPPKLLQTFLAIFNTLGLSQYGPEQIRFLQYRPVLDNRKLKEHFGYIPQKTSEEVFRYFLANRKG